jgi:hypothetical protein
MSAEIENRICDYLRGYGRHDLSALESLAQFELWGVVAQCELLARASRFIEILDENELRAVAAGEVNLVDLARWVAAELKGNKP